LWVAVANFGSERFDSFHVLVPGNDSWFVFQYQYSTKWAVARDEGSIMVNHTIGTRKVMLTVIWGIDRFNAVGMMPPGEHFTSECFLTYRGIDK
jgi:hypothetical protein